MKGQGWTDRACETMDYRHPRVSIVHVLIMCSTDIHYSHIHSLQEELLKTRIEFQLLDYLILDSHGAQ